MTTKYRPDGWKKFYDSEYAMIFDEEQAFEAGADAMLEALRNRVFEGTFQFKILAPEGLKGKFVFIPDDN